MEKYKINRNQKKMSDEQINRHKDFDKLLTNHKKLHHYRSATKPLYKNVKFMGLMVLVGIVLLVLLNDDENETKTKSEPTIKDTIAEVVKADSGQNTLPVSDNTIPTPTPNVQNEVIENSEIAVSTEQVYEHFQIVSKEGAVLYTADGHRVIVPAYAFNSKIVIVKYRKVQVVQAPGTLPQSEQAFVYEIIAEEKATKKLLSLNVPLTIEKAVDIQFKEGKLYTYNASDKSYAISNREKESYRFKVQANAAEFPALTPFQDCVWEFTSGNQPSDFNYIFGRPWKSFTYDFKSMEVKSSNTVFKGEVAHAAQTGNATLNTKLQKAYQTILESGLSSVESNSALSSAKETIEYWKSLDDGKKYRDKFSSPVFEPFFYSTKKTSSFVLTKTGYFVLTYSGKENSTTTPRKRILVIDKTAKKSQLFSDELIQGDPTLRR